MVRRTKKNKKKNVKKRRRTQSGGKMPWMVDVKKGIKVTKDLIRDLKKPIDHEKAKRVVQGYKAAYREYKRRGGTMSYNSWIIAKGYGTRDGTKNCCLM